VLVGQIQNDESLSRNVEHMNPHEVVEHPACRRGLDALAFLVREGGLMLLQDRADTVLEGRIDEQTHRHHHQQGHDALGFFEVERGGQKLRGFEEAKPAFHVGLPFVSSQHRLGGQLALVQFVRREDKTAVLVDPRLAVREPRRQGASDMVDDLGGLGAGPWAPPLPIGGRGADGTVRKKRGLQVVGKTRQGLVGIRFTGKGCAAQRLEGFDFVGTLLAPLLVDGALGLGLARLGLDEHPALRDATIARWHDVIAITLRERRQRLGIGLGQDGLGFVQGRWHAGDPLEAGLGQLGQILGAIESPVGHEIGGVGRGVELRNVVTDELAERFAIMTIATQGLHQHRDTGLVLHH
jgi:hypothetical protein